ncbi:MAG: SIS domain-containing protein [Sphaerochaetaceae bacterium]|nr:SIS domain-containing protein [Sphaerochaetaceae bacterium]
MTAFAPSDTDIQIVQACSLTGEDAAILFSYSGETDHTLRTAYQAENTGATVIAITRIGTNSLSKITDIVLNVPDTEALYRHGATLSGINQMVVVDILYSALVSRRKDAAARIRQTWQAVAHVGRTRNTTVKDYQTKDN